MRFLNHESRRETIFDDDDDDWLVGGDCFIQFAFGTSINRLLDVQRFAGSAGGGFDPIEKDLFPRTLLNPKDGVKSCRSSSPLMI